MAIYVQSPKHFWLFLLCLVRFNQLKYQTEKKCGLNVNALRAALLTLFIRNSMRFILKTVSFSRSEHIHNRLNTNNGISFGLPVLFGLPNGIVVRIIGDVINCHSKTK